MRIIAGRAKGHGISAPKGRNTRPTTDRVREALFSILQDACADSVCLDLFAGSGALGLEALSRGAAEAVFVDKDYQACRVIDQNLRQLGFSEYARVCRMDYQAALQMLARDRKKFDLIFLDPPYAGGLALRAAEKITAEDLLREDGLIVIETDKKTELTEHLPGGLQLRLSRGYGDSVLWIYKAHAETDASADTGEQDTVPAE